MIISYNKNKSLSHPHPPLSLPPQSHPTRDSSGSDGRNPKRERGSTDARRGNAQRCDFVRRESSGKQRARRHSVKQAAHGVCWCPSALMRTVVKAGAFVRATGTTLAARTRAPGFGLLQSWRRRQPVHPMHTAVGGTTRPAPVADGAAALHCARAHGYCGDH